MDAPKLTDETVDKIDQALNAAKARKAKKDGTSPAATTPKAPKVAKEPSEPKRPRLTDEEKASRLFAKAGERAAKKLARDEARSAKKAERDANKSPAHLKKVQRAAERLPSLVAAAQLQFNDITANFTRDQVAAIALHLQHFNRLAATTRALTTKLTAGMQVKITGGDSRFVGQTGTVSKAQRIRAYVAIEGVSKPIYVFTSDVEPISSATVVKSA